MTKKLKVGVLISGRGSNLQALIDACADKNFPAEIVAVISNKADAFGLERAKKAGIPTAAISHKDHSSRESFDAALHAKLKEMGAEFVCLAGFMRILTSGFVEQWPNKMINIHPSLLPSFKGAHSHRDALAAGVKIHGCTVHFVVPEMDSGPIIVQAAVSVLDGDTEDLLAERVLNMEHVAYPYALKAIAEGRVSVNGQAVNIKGAKMAPFGVLNPQS